MAYINTDRRGDLNVKQDDLLASKRFVIERKPDASYFYELEEAVVLDVILDENHPEVKDSCLTAEETPPNIDGSEPQDGDEDYGWIGKIKFRFLKSQVGQEKETLNWAYPIENTGIIEYPLMNEIVIVSKYMNNYYYTRKLNTKSLINSNASFITERSFGLVEQNLNQYEIDAQGNPSPYKGPISKMNVSGGENYEGILGAYFKFNPKIRTLKRFEGDTILESRFGSSIRFGAYDDNRDNDNGIGEYLDGGGNPMILVRNRQAPIKSQTGFSAKGYTLEDINKDGSSIHITSGKTESTFTSVVNKPIISGDEQVLLPKLDGDQIVINSDRIIFSSKANEFFVFSKDRIAMSTDSEFSVDAEEKITLTSMELLSINAPKIYLGNHAIEYEPAILGRTATSWLNTLCKVLIANIDSQLIILNAIISHFHIGNLGRPTSPPAAPALPQFQQQLPKLLAQKQSLEKLRNDLTTLLSSRVFVTGGVDE